MLATINGGLTGALGIGMWTIVKDMIVPVSGTETTSSIGVPEIGQAPRGGTETKPVTFER